MPSQTATSTRCSKEDLVEGRCRGSCNGAMCEERLRLSVVLQVITTGRCMPHQVVHLHTNCLQVTIRTGYVQVTMHLLYAPKYLAYTPVSGHENHSFFKIKHVFKHVLAQKGKLVLRCGQQCMHRKTKGFHQGAAKALQSRKKLHVAHHQQNWSTG